MAITVGRTGAGCVEFAQLARTPMERDSVAREAA